MSIIRHAAAVFICAMMFMGQTGAARADVTETQRLRFGRWAITNNSSSHSITITAGGIVSTSSPTLIMINPPQVGIYRVDSLPAFHVVGSVDVTVNQELQGSGPDFTLDNFTTNIPMADGTGETTLTIGARATTSGDSQNYGDDTYSGELHIEINL